jgi:S-DNA-T family DNA segregation ATPase FtsK/SpoIIIE
VTIHETCAQCHFDGGAFDDHALLVAIRELGPRWRAALETSGDKLRVRPAPAVWSPLEYAAHTRDVTALHVFGVEQALTGTEPVLPAVEPGLADAAAEHYADEDPHAVTAAIEREANKLAGVAQAAGTDAWQHGITLGTNRSNVRQLLEHALHDSVHHLDDLERGRQS